MKEDKRVKNKIYGIITTIFVFWILDFILHKTGVGETNFYYLSKFANAFLFAVIWFFIFDSKSSWKKAVYSIAFGTWISFYYLIASYSGLVQFFGIVARYTPPPFVIFGITFSPFFWWVIHGLGFYLGLEIYGLIRKRK